RDCLLVLFGLLIVWFFASYGCAILGRDWLDANAPPVGNAPFGFWMSQQGSIVVFILILISYRFLMARVDAKHGMVESDSDR
ncbi:MAG: DUF4212 domain-containing protein, partial [Verrucomicrobiota bacterium]